MSIIIRERGCKVGERKRGGRADFGGYSISDCGSFDSARDRLRMRIGPRSARSGAKLKELSPPASVVAIGKNVWRMSRAASGSLSVSNLALVPIPISIIFPWAISDSDSESCAVWRPRSIAAQIYESNTPHLSGSRYGVLFGCQAPHGMGSLQGECRQRAGATHRGADSLRSTRVARSSGAWAWLCTPTQHGQTSLTVPPLFVAFRQHAWAWFLRALSATTKKAI